MGHLSYIANFANYAKKIECERCEKISRRRQDYKRHLPSSPNIVKYSYPGGYFTLEKNIFEMLEEVDIFVPKNERFYPYFAAYDLEAMMKHVEYTQNNRLKWLSKNIPFCVGICSNIPGYKEPYVYINDDMNDLVTNMISFLNEISSKSNMLCKQK